MAVNGRSLINTYAQGFRSTAFGASMLVAFGCTSAFAHDLKVVASIKPVHSLVAQVMGDTGSPDLLVDGLASPHTYSLKPSEAGKLQSADVVFWISPNLETFLVRPLENIAGDAKSVALIEGEGVKTIKQRSGARFEAHSHDHGDHGHGDHDHGEEKHASHDDHDHDDHAHDDHDHKKDDHDDHAHDDHAHDDHDHKKDDHDDHDHGEDKHDHSHNHDHKHDDHADHDEDKHDDHAHDKHDDHDHDKEDHAGHDHGDHALDQDSHIWLDPQNAAAMIDTIVETLGKADPDHMDEFKKNGEAAKAKLVTLEKELAEKLKPVAASDAEFIVFHDAYQYFEQRFGLEAAGAISINPEVLPGAKRIGEIRSTISELNVSCVFYEPQFNRDIVSTLTEENNVNETLIDPLGSVIPAGAEFYGELLGQMSASFIECLGTES